MKQTAYDKRQQVIKSLLSSNGRTYEGNGTTLFVSYNKTTDQFCFALNGRTIVSVAGILAYEKNLKGFVKKYNLTQTLNK